MGNFEFFLKSDLATLISACGRFYFCKKMGGDIIHCSSAISILSGKPFPFTDQLKSKRRHTAVKEED